jgi:hypothetical protein
MNRDSAAEVTRLVGISIQLSVFDSEHWQRFPERLFLMADSDSVFARVMPPRHASCGLNG